MPKVRDWDGASYDRISGPMEAMGRAVLERLELDGGETVLDAGCGSGRVTALLVERLPRGRVIAVDADGSMVREARTRLESCGERVQVLEADLLELELPAPVAAVLSTATFHWISDHERLFARLRALLEPGGRLVAQCGGRGNVHELRAVAEEVLRQEPYVEHVAGWEGPWNYATAEDTHRRLLDAGFSEARCWLAENPVVRAEPREYLRTIVLGAHVQRLPEELRESWLDAVLGALPAPVTVDYVRLNIDAAA
jgi:trans-aconitate 2-methyltransferase